MQIQTLELLKALAVVGVTISLLPVIRYAKQILGWLNRKLNSEARRRSWAIWIRIVGIVIITALIYFNTHDLQKLIDFCRTK